MRQIIKFNDNWHFWKDTSNINIQDGGNDYFRGSCVLQVCSA